MSAPVENAPRQRPDRRVLSRKPLISVCLVLVYLVWGTSYPAIRLMVAPAHAHGLPTWFAAGFRLLLAGGILLCVGAASRRGRAAIRRIEGKQFHAAIRSGLLLSFATGILTAFAARQIGSGLLATLMATSPLWTALLAAATGRRLPSSRTFCGIGLGLAGVAALGSDAAFTLDPGVLLAAGAAIMWSIGSWYTARVALPAEVWLAAGVSQAFSGLALLCVAIASGELGQLTVGPVSPTSWIALAYLACVSMSGFTAYSWLLTNVNPLMATTHAFVNPVVASLVGALILQEQLRPVVLGSAALVGLGALLILSARQTPEVNRPGFHAVFRCEDSPGGGSGGAA